MTITKRKVVDQTRETNVSMHRYRPPALQHTSALVKMLEAVCRIYKLK